MYELAKDLPRSTPDDRDSNRRGRRYMNKRNTHRVLIYGVAVLLAGATLIGGGLFMIASPDDTPLATVSGNALGTTFRVVYRYSTAARIDQHTTKVVIASELDSIDRTFSSWRDNSYVNIFNRAVPGTELPMAPRFVSLLRISESVRATTEGAFNVGIGRLTKMWRSGREPDVPLPSDVEIRRAVASIRSVPATIAVRADYVRGWSYCAFGAPGSDTITKSALPLEIEMPHLDFSAIAKGYAVDRIFESLGAIGATDCMIELGGEVRVKGTWTIGIEAPTPGERRIAHTVELTDAALATSGDYRNFVVRDGKRYSHIIDPRTGYPIDHDLASASVIADTCAEADALATALMVMGPTEARAFAEREQLAVLLIERRDDGFVTWMSPNWPRE